MGYAYDGANLAAVYYNNYMYMYNYAERNIVWAADANIVCKLVIKYYFLMLASVFVCLSGSCNTQLLQIRQNPAKLVATH